MTPQEYNILFETICWWCFVILVIEVGFFILFMVGSYVMQATTPSPEVIYYFQNCNNLTLYPQGCQVLS